MKGGETNAPRRKCQTVVGEIRGLDISCRPREPTTSGLLIRQMAKSYCRRKAARGPSQCAHTLTAAMRAQPMVDDNTLIEQILYEYRHRIARFGPNNAGDMHQEMWLRLHRAADRFRPDANGKARLRYLRVVATGAINDCWRGLQKGSLPVLTCRTYKDALAFSELDGEFDDGKEMDGAVFVEDTMAAIANDPLFALQLQEFLASLPDMLRRIALLSLGGYSVHDIGVFFDRTESRIAQCRREIKEQFCKYWNFTDTEGRSITRK